MRTFHHELESEIQLDMPTCYTDLRIALCWVKEEDKEWKQFVENRVSEIRRLIPAKHWKHCAGTKHPADILSRGTTPAELQEKITFWLYGPSWPVSGKGESSAVHSDMPQECLQEL